MITLLRMVGLCVVTGFVLGVGSGLPFWKILLFQVAFILATLKNPA